MKEDKRRKPWMRDAHSLAAQRGIEQRDFEKAPAFDARANAHAALARASGAVAAGDALGAERWTRLAGKLSAAQDFAAADETEEIEAVRQDLRARLARFAEADRQRAARACGKDRAWEDGIWNSIRTEAGLPSLTPDAGPDGAPNADKGGSAE